MKPKKLADFEVDRIKARIRKCERRIAAGYVPVDKRGESERDRMARLSALLAQQVEA